MGELRVDPVLPLDPYFSSNSANSFLFGGEKIGKELFILGQDEWMHSQAWCVKEGPHSQATFLPQQLRDHFLYMFAPS